MAASQGASTLSELAQLEAITQIISLLDTHMGLSDKSLAKVGAGTCVPQAHFPHSTALPPAQFMLKLCMKKQDPEAVKKFLAKKGIQLSDSLVASVLQVVRSATAPAAGSGSGTASHSAAAPDGDELTRQFPGLAMPNKLPAWMAEDEAAAAAAAAPPTAASAAVGAEAHRTERRGEDDGRHAARGERGRSRSPPPSRGGGRPPLDASGRPVYGRADERRGGRHGAPEGPVQLHGIYRGNVSRLLDFGAIVDLQGVYPRANGMVHVSAMRMGARVEHPSQVVHRGEMVWVKVLSIAGNRISLSMKDVDQSNGRDLMPTRGAGPGYAAPPAASAGPQTDILSRVRAEELGQHSRRMKRLTSPERFELQQLAASGVLAPEDMPDFDEEEGVLAGAGEDMEEVEVEIVEEEAPFLAGQTEHSRELSPVKVVAQPDGSLHRAAMLQSALAKERRELKQTQEQAVLDAIPKDLNRGWMDPLPEAGSRHLADDMRGVLTANMSGQAAVPEWKAKVEAGNFSMGKITTTSIAEQRASLPIAKLRGAFLEAVAQHQVLVVVGETGSGKTTQMTQYLAEAGWGRTGMIGCTQPRRVAAMSIAERVAEEFGCPLGEEVGYAVRFDDRTSPKTTIKYMTDGMLMREYLMDNSLKRYSVMILDEAHERSLNTDVLMGLLKDLLRRRRDFRLVCTSATLESDKFRKYFFDCPCLQVPGRAFDVEVLYVKEPVTDYVEQALATVMDIHLNEARGDILVFLTGKDEIDTACETLYNRMKALGPKVPELVIHPVYASQPAEVQSRIFEPAPKFGRKVIIATNIAEASLTIDGIVYVVDPGFVKQMVFNPKTNMDALVVVPVSQASATQRTGRAGRTGPGKCYRLFTHDAFKHEMLPATVPEIQRTNLASVVLQLKAMGINDLVHFDFMDPPPPQTLIAALEHLYVLGALDDEGLLTRVGRRMAEFPMAPAHAKMLLTSVDLGCSEEILTVVAMLSVENIFHRPKDKQTAADQKKAKFHAPEGDHLTYLNVYNSWAAAKFSNAWCHDAFVQARAMRRAQDVRKQLVNIMDRYKLDIVSAGRNYNLICKAICAGYFKNACKKDPSEGYRTLADGTVVFMHPSSALFNKQPQYCIYNEVVLTTKEYMRSVMVIDPKWLVELAPRYFKKADTSTLSRHKRREKIEPLYDRFNPPDLWRLSKRIAYRS